MIESAKYADKEQKSITVSSNGAISSVPVDESNSDYHKVLAWVAKGNTIDPYEPPPEPTLDDVYDQALQNNRIIKGLVLALNDGSITVGGNMTPAQLKAAIKAKM